MEFLNSYELVHTVSQDQSVSQSVLLLRLLVLLSLPPDDARVAQVGVHGHGAAVARERLALLGPQLLLDAGVRLGVHFVHLLGRRVAGHGMQAIREPSEVNFRFGDDQSEPSTEVANLPFYVGGRYGVLRAQAGLTGV